MPKLNVGPNVTNLQTGETKPHHNQFKRIKVNGREVLECTTCGADYHSRDLAQQHMKVYR